jgi:hypothetical protein
VESALKPLGVEFKWWRYPYPWIARHLPTVAKAVGAALASALALALSVQFAAAALDRALAGAPATGMVALAGLAALTAGIFAVSRGTAAAQLVARVANEALEQAFRPLARLPDAFFVDRHFSQIVAKLDAPTVLGRRAGWQRRRWRWHPWSCSAPRRPL